MHLSILAASSASLNIVNGSAFLSFAMPRTKQRQRRSAPSVSKPPSEGLHKNNITDTVNCALCKHIEWASEQCPPFYPSRCRAQNSGIREAPHPSVDRRARACTYTE